MDYNNLKQKLEAKYNGGLISDLELCQLTNIYIELEDYEKAFAILKKEAVDRNSSYLMNNLGYYYLTIGEYIENRWFYRPDKAIEVLEKAITLNPKDANPYVILGACYLKQSRWHEASEVLRHAVQLKTDYVICNNLGVSLYHEGFYQEAATYFLRAHHMADTAPTYYPYFNYCLTHISMGNLEETQSAMTHLKNDILNEETSEIDEIDLARLNYLIQNYEEVVYLFQNTSIFYQLELTDFAIYIAALKRIGQEEVMHDVIAETLEDEQSLLDDFENPTSEQIERITAEIEAYKKMADDVKQGLKPVLAVSPYMEEDCYLYECIVHSL